MLKEYLGLGIMLTLAIVVGLALPLLARYAGPRRLKKIKLAPYESGMDPVGTARDRFSVKFYLIAMLFIIFDIEVIFMYPWAVQFKEMAARFGMFPFIEMLVFVVILFAGYIYLLKKGAFDWD